VSAMQGYEQFSGLWQKNAQLAWDAINSVPSVGIATSGLNVMEWSVLEKLGGHQPGSYPRDPQQVYLDFQLAAGACFISQWIPENPLSMTAAGFDEDAEHGAATGAEQIVLDGIRIDSPEAVIEHLERFVFPDLIRRTAALDVQADARVRDLIQGEVAVQRLFGMNLLKGPYEDFKTFPYFEYSRYGYVDYFAAYALYPEVIERHFCLQADHAVKSNALAARAMVDGGLPRMVILDHDMADSRGTLVDVRSLDRIWFPHFCRSIEPFLRAGITLLWHCDGNLMAMVPRLIASGVRGFQGFQYEDGMDYERICRMKDRDGRDLCIMAGVSVTRTLPFGTTDDVAREMRWLVDNGPRTGLFLAPSSSIAPRTPLANITALLDGFAYYREHGRGK
jgi:hypothetical protein